MDSWRINNVCYIIKTRLDSRREQINISRIRIAIALNTYTYSTHNLIRVENYFYLINCIESVNECNIFVYAEQLIFSANGDRF